MGEELERESYILPVPIERARNRYLLIIHASRFLRHFFSLFLACARTRRFVRVCSARNNGAAFPVIDVVGSVELYTRRLPFPLGGRYVAVEGSSSVLGRAIEIRIDPPME